MMEEIWLVYSIDLFDDSISGVVCSFRCERQAKHFSKEATRLTNLFFNRNTNQYPNYTSWLAAQTSDERAIMKPAGPYSVRYVYGKLQHISTIEDFVRP